MREDDPKIMPTAANTLLSAVLQIAVHSLPEKSLILGDHIIWRPTDRDRARVEHHLETGKKRMLRSFRQDSPVTPRSAGMPCDTFGMYENVASYAQVPILGNRPIGHKDEVEEIGKVFVLRQDKTVCIGRPDGTFEFLPGDLRAGPKDCDGCV